MSGITDSLNVIIAQGNLANAQLDKALLVGEHNTKLLEEILAVLKQDD